MLSKLIGFHKSRLLLSSFRLTYGFAQGNPKRDLYGKYYLTQMYWEYQKMHPKTSSRKHITNWLKNIILIRIVMQGPRINLQKSTSK